MDRFRGVNMHYDIDASCQIPRDLLIDIYRRYFNDKTDGHYVEVGAFDGVSYGCTSALAKVGWRGLCVEAHPEYAERCRKNHEGLDVVVEACAAGATEGDVTLYVKGEYSSTVWCQAAVEYGLDPSQRIVVPMRRLDDILLKHGVPAEFDLLTVDVEEAEMEVLAGFDVRRWLPRVAVIETHETDSAPCRNWKGPPVAAYFTAVGYTKIHADHINSIFVRQ
jgi:FkbM family methyltransferase